MVCPLIRIGIVGIEARDFGFEIPSAARSQEVPNFSTQSMDNRRTITGKATKSFSIAEDKNKRQVGSPGALSPYLYRFEYDNRGRYPKQKRKPQV